MFDDLLGNDVLKSYLSHAVAAQTLPQTLLFIGPDGIGKKQFAFALAAHLLRTTSDRLSNHPDFHLLIPEGKAGVYAIETVRNFIDKEHRAPFLAPKKIFVLDQVDRMQPASANALLKTLEEPSADTQFFLITSRPQDLLPTILSRCVSLKFQPLSDKEVAQVLQRRGLNESFAHLAQGSAARALELSEGSQLETYKNLLFSLLKSSGNYLEIAEKTAKIEALIDEIEDPASQAQMTEHLFALILMWHRDQHARAIGAGPLFFPEEPPHPCQFGLEKIERKVAQAALAKERNLKLSVCLEQILSA